jgi:hypothetical protein
MSDQDRELIQNMDLLMDLDLFEEEGLADLVKEMDDLPTVEEVSTEPDEGGASDSISEEK